MGDYDHYDYTVDMDDDSDCIDFGKWIGHTPANVLIKNPGWLVWAWENTNKWVGSVNIIRLACDKVGKKFTERVEESPSPIKLIDQLAIDEFERAVFEAYGCYPITVRNTIHERDSIPRNRS